MAYDEELRTHLFDINQRSRFIIDQQAHKLSSFLRANSHDVLQQRVIVGTIVNLLRVQNDLLELTRLCEARDDRRVSLLDYVAILDASSVLFSVDRIRGCRGE
jgi:hypothetical protein